MFAFDHGAAATPTHNRVDEALPERGTLLDVGSGEGAASLPMAARASGIVAVDESEMMLKRFAEAAERAGAVHAEVLGEWPGVSASVAAADVVVCANVVYNIAGIVSFVTALVNHAQHRVVVEASARHPLTATAPLWNRFHPAAPRPDGPSVDDLVAVLARWASAVRPSSSSVTALPGARVRSSSPSFAAACV
jgi:Methyltransferase domain